MALKQKSAFLFSYSVTDLNKYLDFANSTGGTELVATMRTGYYSLDGLLTELVRALTEADPVNTYTATANRTTFPNQNRITVASTTIATTLELRFASGTHSVNNCASLLGFNATDYTGALTYTGATSTGIYLLPALIGYSYQPTDTFKRTQGVVNVSASGVKEVVTFSTNQFFQVEFRFEPEASAITTWETFFDWATIGAEMDFIPDITAQGTYVRCTLEKTDQDGKGLGFMMKEMLPDFPFFYRTGIMQFRKVVT